MRPALLPRLPRLPRLQPRDFLPTRREVVFGAALGFVVLLILGFFGFVPCWPA